MYVWTDLAKLLIDIEAIQEGLGNIVKSANSANLYTFTKFYKQTFLRKTSSRIYAHLINKYDLI